MSLQPVVAVLRRKPQCAFSRRTCSCLGVTSHLVSPAWPRCWSVVPGLLGAPQPLGVVLGADLLVDGALFCVWGVLAETALAGVG